MRRHVITMERAIHRGYASVTLQDSIQLQIAARA